MNKQNTILIQIVLAIILAILFIPYLGAVHLFDWDEINFAESAREMLVTGNYLDVQINYEAFWEKPPLFFWIQVLSMKLFGVNEFAARFPNAIIGIVSMLVLFNIGKKLYDIRFGLIWVMVYTGSFLPFFYFKSGIIDPLFNLFIFLGIYQFYLFSVHTSTKKYWPVFLSAMFIGLANLTKGPVALLIFLLSAFIYMVIKAKYRQFFHWRVWVIYLITFAFFGGFWFILQFLNGNYTVLVDFVHYMIRLLKEQDAGHGGFFGYHFVVLFFGVFPASVFAVKSMGTASEKDFFHRNFKLWMVVLFWVVLILFTLVRTKIVHYSSLAYFPLTFLAALTVYRMMSGQMKIPLWIKVLVSIMAFVWGSIVTGFYFLEESKSFLAESGIIQDAFTIGNLEARVHWPFAIVLIGMLFIILILFFLWGKRNAQTRLAGVFMTSLVFIELVIILVVPRIEKYSQHAAIEFYKERIGEDCYVDTYAFKSYAHYFYSRMPDHPNEKSKVLEWLLSGQADKTVYIVCKNTKQERFERENPHFERMQSKNGFVFYVLRK